MVIKMSNTAITNTVVLGLGRSEPKEEKSLLKEVNGGFKKNLNKEKLTLEFCKLNILSQDK